jgi:hypothetical protein
MRYRGPTAIAHDATPGVNCCGEMRALRRHAPATAISLGDAGWHKRLKNNSAARDQTIVDYHGSRPGKVSAGDFQPISSPLARMTISPPSSLLTQQAGNALEKGSDMRRRPLACAGEPWLFASPTRFSQCLSPLRVGKHIVAWSAMYSPSRTARKTPQVAIVTRRLQLVKGQFPPVSAIYFSGQGVTRWPSVFYN